MDISEEAKKNIESCEQKYQLFKETKGEKDPETIKALGELAKAYYDVDRDKMFELHDKVYSLYCEVFGEKQPETIKYLKDIVNLLSVDYFNENDAYFKKAYEIETILYELLKEKKDWHDALLEMLFAIDYCVLAGDFEKAHNLFAEWYRLYIETADYKNDPMSLCEELYNNVYSDCDLVLLRNNRYERAAEAIKFLFQLQEEFGFDVYSDYNNYTDELDWMILKFSIKSSLQQSLELNEWLYPRLRKKGYANLETFDALAHACYQMENNKKIVELYEHYREKLKGYLDKCDLDTPEAFYTMYDVYWDGIVDGKDREFELGEKVYSLYKEVLGDNHPATMEYLDDLAFKCGERGYAEKAEKYYSILYKLKEATPKNDGLDMQAELRSAIFNSARSGDLERTMALCRQWKDETGRLTFEITDMMDDYLIFLISDREYQESLDGMKLTARLVAGLFDKDDDDHLKSLDECMLSDELAESLKTVYRSEKEFLDNCEFGDLPSFYYLKMLADAYFEIGKEEKACELRELRDHLAVLLENDIHSII